MSSHELGFSIKGKKEEKKKRKEKKRMPNKWRTIKSLVQKFDFTVDEGKERLNSSRDKNSGKQRRRKVEESCVAFLL